MTLLGLQEPHEDESLKEASLWGMAFSEGTSPTSRPVLPSPCLQALT